MTTKSMLIICSWCKSKTPMNTNKMWWNFQDPIWADPIGYCSEECIKYAQVQKELIKEKAGL